MSRMVQYGFFFDQARCTGCHACSIACKQWYDIPVGPVKFMRVYEWEKGFFPSVRLHMLAIPCYHCEEPVCLNACPNHAIYKEEKYGAVLIDKEKCKGTRKCWKACPYGSILYASDDLNEKAQKCTMCIDRLEQGQAPICILSCSLRALDFGPLEELEKRYGHNKDLEDLPDSKNTRPAVIFKPHDPKKQILPWDPDEALDLWQRPGFSGSTLPLLRSKSDLTGAPRGLIGRDRLVLKARKVRDLMYYTSDDE